MTWYGLSTTINSVSSQGGRNNNNNKNNNVAHAREWRKCICTKGKFDKNKNKKMMIIIIIIIIGSG
jgi:hypothetical protein